MCAARESEKLKLGVCMVQLKQVHLYGALDQRVRHLREMERFQRSVRVLEMIVDHWNGRL